MFHCVLFVSNDESLAEDSRPGDNDRPPISNVTTAPTDNHHLQAERDGIHTHVIQLYTQLNSAHWCVSHHLLLTPQAE